MSLWGREKKEISKDIFVCPFCTVFTEKVVELIVHLRKEHREATLAAYAEEQKVNRIQKNDPAL